MNNKETTRKAIVEQGLLPLFFEEDVEVSLQIIRALYSAGVRVLEYTNRGAAALANYRYLMKEIVVEMPDLQLGIGTVKTLQEAEDFLAAGAHFVVCPVVDQAVGSLVHEAGLLWIPGCMTPTEINVAHQHNAEIIKLFPANILGPSYVSAIKELFPGQLFLPTGGVEIEEKNIQHWFKAGVCAVGMGSKLISNTLLEQRDYERLSALTSEVLEMIARTRSRGLYFR